MKTRYLTDAFSTLSGLAAVAYGDPDYFREVQNQIYASSPTKFMDFGRPSAVWEDAWGTADRLLDKIIAALNIEYSSGGEFTDFMDVELGPDWRNRVRSQLAYNIPLSFDTLSEYGITLSDYVEYALAASLDTTSSAGSDGAPDANLASVSGRVVSYLESDPVVGPDILVLSRAINNNPQTKLNKPPLDSVINLTNSVDLGRDYRGIEFSSAYLPPNDYWSGLAFPGAPVGNMNVLPPQIRDSISQGYEGYLSSTPLESIYNPVGSLSISQLPSPSPSASGMFSPGSVWEELPEQLQGDRDVYSISLIGEQINGYTSFDPATMSNGDFVDQSLVPQFEDLNSDPQGGLNASARTFNQAF